MPASTSQILLLIDTSGPAGTVALAVDGGLASRRHSEQARDHAAVVNSAIAEILQESGLKLADLTGVCVLAGPGSYTGLRIALATAKGLCYALEILLFLQNNLEVLAADARASSPNHDAYLVVLPARSSEYFLAAYGASGDVLVEPRHVMKAELPALLAALPPDAVACGAKEASEEICSTSPIRFLPEVDLLKAWIATASAQVARGKSAPLAGAVPFYLKAAFTTTPKPHIK